MNVLSLINWREINMGSVKDGMLISVNGSAQFIDWRAIQDISDQEYNKQRVGKRQTASVSIKKTFNILVNQLNITNFEEALTLVLTSAIRHKDIAG